MESAATPPEPLAGYLKSAQKFAIEQAREFLRDADKARPLVLISEDGKSAAAFGQELESSGFTNIYVVEGGVEA